MLKAKKYNIEETNIALLGSELEKKVKEAAAGHEIAWKNAGTEAGVQVWRVENFKVVPWPKQEYGKFYEGDSYIVLKTEKKNNVFHYDVYFWLGDETSQDEAGTAAYKTVELDDYLKGLPVQHREVQGSESSSFVNLFTPPGLRILSGGVKSGFRHVKPEEYKPRLLHIKGKKAIRIYEVELSYKSLNSGDSFLLDAGLNIYTWIGAKASIFEKNKAAQLSQALDDERDGLPTKHIIAEGDKDGSAADFWKILGGEGPIASESTFEELDDKTDKKLLKISNDSGSLVVSEVFSGTKIDKSLLSSGDVFIIDLRLEIYVWVGKNSSAEEKKNGFTRAQEYLKKHGRSPYIPITTVLEGAENETLLALF